MDCSLPGPSAHGIFQARVLEWVAIAFSTSHRHGWLNCWPLVAINHQPPLPGNQGLQIPTLCCSVLKSHLIYINPVVVERGLLKITFHFYGSEAISGTEDRRPNPVSHCSSDSRNFKGFGIYEQRSLDKNQKYVENIL